VRHGRGVHVLEGEEYLVAAGVVFVVRTNDVHGYRDMAGLDLVNVVFDPERFLAPDSDLQHLPGYHALFHLEPIFRREHAFQSRLHLGKEQLRYVYDCIEPMADEYAAGRPGYRALVRAHFTLLVGYLARQYAVQPNEESRSLLGFSQVVSYIEGNYQRPVALEALADVAGVSKNTLLRTFRRCYGVSPIDYLIRHRLKRARDLLDRRDLSITDVAFQVGFMDSNYFSRQFRRVYGKPPSLYRRTQAAARP